MHTIKLKFISHSLASALLSLHVGVFLGVIFAFTNDGRRINFGRRFFEGDSADLFVFLFWLLTPVCVIIFVAIVAYPSIKYLNDKLSEIVLINKE